MSQLSEKIIQVAKKSWERYGAEVLQESGEYSLEQDDVIDFAMDYLTEFLSPEDIKKYRKLSFEEKTEILKQAFPHRSYG